MVPLTRTVWGGNRSRSDTAKSGTAAQGTAAMTQSAPCSTASKSAPNEMPSSATPGRYLTFSRLCVKQCAALASCVHKRVATPLPASKCASAVPQLPAPSMGHKRQLRRAVERIRFFQASRFLGFSGRIHLPALPCSIGTCCRLHFSQAGSAPARDADRFCRARVRWCVGFLFGRNAIRTGAP